MEPTDALAALRSTAEHGLQRSTFNKHVTSITLAILLALIAIGWWRDAHSIKISSIEISNVQILSKSELCPGDTLIIGYDLTINGLGKVIFDDSVYYMGRPVKFSETSGLIVSSSRTLMTEDEWVIPARPGRNINGQRAWAAGEYIRLISVAPSNGYVSRFTPPGVLEVPFRIASAEDCP